MKLKGRTRHAISSSNKAAEQFSETVIIPSLHSPKTLSKTPPSQCWFCFTKAKGSLTIKRQTSITSHQTPPTSQRNWGLALLQEKGGELDLPRKYHSVYKPHHCSMGEQQRVLAYVAHVLGYYQHYCKFYYKNTTITVNKFVFLKISE